MRDSVELTMAQECRRIELETSDLLVRTLLALEVAYQYSHGMPDHVRALIKNRIEEARTVL